jgi:hypothetical protein
VGATISKLAVKLTADTGKFVQGMNKGSKGVNKMSKSTMGFGAKLGIVGAAVAGATAGILALSRAASKVSEAFVRMDAVAKTARSINMAAQSFQGLQHAASLAGVEGEQMTGGLSKMLKGLGEAAMGLGQARIAMEQLGISTLDMQQLSTEEQFLKIADALNKVDDPAKRAALAVQFFGRTGLKLLPMIEQGSEAIRQQAAEMERLQGPMTDLDFTNIEEGNDAANRFGKTVEGVWNQLASAIAPAKKLVFDTLTEAGSSLANFIGENKESITAFFTNIGTMISDAVKAIVRLVQTFFKIGKALNDARNSVADFTENLLGVRLGITDMLIPLKAAWEILKKITGNSESDQLSDQIDKWNQKIADQQKAIEDLDRGLSRIRSAEITDEETPAAVLSYDELLQKADQLKEKNASAIREAEDLTATLRQQIALGDDAVMSKEEQEALQKRINELEQKANQHKQDYLETSKKINKEEQDMQKRADRLVEGLKTQAEKYQEQLAEIEELKKHGKLSPDQARRLRLQVEAKIQSDVDKVVEQQAKVAEAAAKEREEAMKSWNDAAKNAASKATTNLVRAGSKEMFEQVAERQFKKDNPLAKFQKKSTKIATDQLDELKTVNDNLSRLNTVVNHNAGGSSNGGNDAMGGIVEVGLGA